MFSQKDLDYFKLMGIPIDNAEQQLKQFEEGFPYLQIISPATIDRGITLLTSEEQDRYISLYRESSLSRARFIPASGAATRMFKDIYDGSQLDSFFDSIEEFPFFSKLADVTGFDINDRESVINALLSSSGLNYGSLPKGVLLFHKYENEIRTPFEEQLVESVKYSMGPNSTAEVFFTITEEHLAHFRPLSEMLMEKFRSERGVDLNIQFTFQKKSTDTIAIDSNGRPFRDSDGMIFLRPGGHGALIKNLQEVNSDVVFIKNIDNVTREESLDDTIRWKEILAGCLIETKYRVNSYLTKLDGEFSHQLNLEIIDYLKDRFCVEIPSLPPQLIKEFLYAKLNRPIRVCGMVKNEGEPGGGPFLTRDADGSTSLQIVESAQLDRFNDNYDLWLGESSHFNPVDIVCSIFDYNGDKFDLDRFIDKETGFISEKNISGNNLKVLELPGLWNGAMSNWNTIFIEVPATTFNPVKGVCDLLRPSHTGIKK